MGIGCGGFALLGVLASCTLAMLRSASRRATASATPQPQAQQPTVSQVDAWKKLPAKDHLAAGEAFLKRVKETHAHGRKYLEASLKDDNAKAPADILITKQEDAEARTRLGLITPDQPEYPRAQAILSELKEEDRKSEAFMKVWEAKLAVVGRKDYGKQLEERLLTRRMNVDVTVSGKENTVLTLRYVLANKVLAHDLSSSDLLGEMEKKGFKKFVLTDGYEHSWTWDLTKKD